MNDLVEVVGEKPMVNSVFVAEKFGKAHTVVLRSIRNLQCSEEFSLNNFARSEYKNARGKVVPCYMMTRDGFSFLCMGFTGKEAAKWKEAYINAFNQMEAELLKQQEKKDNKVAWEQARLQGKATRRDITDTIKEFVEYAEAQGSRSARMYYPNITKMEYAALEIIEKGSKIPDNFRDTLDRMDLCFLMAAEQVAQLAIRKGMRDGLHYKEVYQLAKQQVQIYADAVRIPRLEQK